MANNILRLKVKYRNSFSNRIASRVLKSPRKESLTLSVLSFLFKIMLLSIFAGLIFFPFYYMAVTSLMTKHEVMDSIKPHLVPDSPKWENFGTVLKEGFSYWKSLLVTAIISVVSVMLKIVVTMSFGYAFSFKKWRLKKLFWTIALATIMLPEIALMNGQYSVMAKFGWVTGRNVIFALFIPFVASVFSGFMFKNAFQQIPTRTKEASLIDGVGGFRYFIKVAAPMVAPTTWTICILTALASWNSFMWPSLLLSGQGKDSIQVITTWLFQTGHPLDPQDTRILTNIRLAGAILVMLPTFIIYFLLRTRIMKAISKQGSAIKG